MNSKLETASEQLFVKRPVVITFQILKKILW